MSFLDNDEKWLAARNKRIKRWYIKTAKWLFKLWLFWLILMLFCPPQGGMGFTGDHSLCPGISLVPIVPALVIPLLLFFTALCLGQRGVSYWKWQKKVNALIKEDFDMTKTEFEDLMRVTGLLKIERERIKDWYIMFVEIDYLAQNQIPIEDFFEYFDIETTHFSRRAFSLYASTYTGKLSFVEFVLSVYNYCSADFESLVRYVFDQFDDDQNQILDHNELEALLTFVHSVKLDERVNLVVTHIKEMYPHGLDIDRFLTCCTRYPVLIYPAVYIQDVMRGSVPDKNAALSNETYWGVQSEFVREHVFGESDFDHEKHWQQRHAAIVPEQEGEDMEAEAQAKAAKLAVNLKRKRRRVQHPSRFLVKLGPMPYFFTLKAAIDWLQLDLSRRAAAEERTQLAVLEAHHRERQAADDARARIGGSEKTFGGIDEQERPPTAPPEGRTEPDTWNINILGRDAKEVENALSDSVCNTFEDPNGVNPETAGGEVVRKGHMQAATLKVKREALYRDRRQQRADRQTVNEVDYTAKFDAQWRQTLKMMQQEHAEHTAFVTTGQGRRESHTYVESIGFAQKLEEQAKQVEHLAVEPDLEEIKEIQRTQAGHIVEKSEKGKLMLGRKSRRKQLALEAKQREQREIEEGMKTAGLQIRDLDTLMGEHQRKAEEQKKKPLQQWNTNDVFKQQLKRNRHYAR